MLASKGVKETFTFKDKIHKDNALVKTTTCDIYFLILFYQLFVEYFFTASNLIFWSEGLREKP